MPYWSNNEDNSGNRSPGNESDNYSNWNDQDEYPEWDSEKAEAFLEAALQKELAKKNLTRKQLNNALRKVLPKNQKNTSMSFFQHVVRGNLRDVKQFIDEGYDINRRAKDNTSALHYALYSPQAGLMIKLLCDAGINVNAFNNRSHTPLHVAILQLHGHCSEKDFNVINYLIDRGALSLPVRYGLSLYGAITQEAGAITARITKLNPMITANRKQLDVALEEANRIMSIANRVADIDTDHVHLLKFKTMATQEPISFMIDTRASVGTMKDYLRYWIFHSDSRPKLLLKAGKNTKTLDDDLVSLDSLGLNEDSDITVIPPLKSGFGGGKTRRRRR